MADRLSLNDVFEESIRERGDFRGTRIAPATTLVLGTALVTQLLVLSSIAIIMGVAVVTMCALLVELLVLTLVATVLERGVVELDDLGSLMEIAATVVITAATIVIASVGGGHDVDKKALLEGTAVAALKFS